MFTVVQPPKDEGEFARIGKELFDAAERLGLELDAEGFLFSWTAGTRVVVQRAADNTIISLALVTIGKRWLHKDFTATVLALRGNRTPTMDFIKIIANAMGATSIFVEEAEALEETPVLRRYIVQEIILQ